MTGTTELTAEQVAAHLGVKLRTVHAYTSRGGLEPVRRVGRTPIYTVEGVDQWKAARPGRGNGGAGVPRPNRKARTE